VRTWAQRDTAVAGVVREIAPAADPATRTFSARVALPTPQADIRLGMTATVSFSAPLPPGIRLPLTALLNDQGKTSVWVVEKGKVKLVPVVLAGPQGNEILVASGLDAGQEVVIAGVHLLREGQKVSILGRPATTTGTTQ
jgi:RND family efflux transporter MFP subunit